MPQPQQKDRMDIRKSINCWKQLRSLRFSTSCQSCIESISTSSRCWYFIANSFLFLSQRITDCWNVPQKTHFDFWFWQQANIKPHCLKLQVYVQCSIWSNRKHLRVVNWIKSHKSDWFMNLSRKASNSATALSQLPCKFYDLQPSHWSRSERQSQFVQLRTKQTSHVPN